MMMRRIISCLFSCISLVNGATAQEWCTAIDRSKWDQCKGEYFFKDPENGQIFKIVSFFKNGNSSGDAELFYSDQSKYIGEILNGKRDGRGIYYLSNGNRLIGSWKSDKLHGPGLEISKDGKILKEGKWQFGELLDANLTVNVKENKSKYAKEFKEIAVSSASGCKFIFYAKVENISQLNNPKLNWNGACDNGFLSGYGEIDLRFDKLVEYKVKGDFKNGQMSGFVEGVAIFEGYRATFKAEVKDGMNLFGIIEMETKTGSKIIYSGEAYYLTFEGRGILNNVTQGIVIDGSFKNGKANGYAVITNKKTNDRYEGEVVDGLKNGRGIFSYGDGKPNQEGIWKDDLLVKSKKINVNDIDSMNQNKTELVIGKDIENKSFDSKKSLNLNVDINSPDKDGVATLKIKSNRALISLKVDAEEFGASVDGQYSVARIPKIDGETQYKITAIDSFGNKAVKVVSINRNIASSSPRAVSELRPQNIKLNKSNSEAVAIIIGVEKYKRLSKADYANDDARAFYDYAVRALGIRPDNIKLLVDENADAAEIYRAFQNWLPLKTQKTKSDIFVFFSGHGMPSQDGSALYLLPWGVDKDFVEKTAINQQELIASLLFVQPRTVTMFIDSCYSGQTRGGETLLVGARPIAIKAHESAYPPNFTVISASSNDQISSASPDLKHGIFSYFLMKGMEGDADLSKDGKITASEMQEYLTEMVGRQAMGMNRKQQPQLFGDAERVLVGR